MLCTEMMLHMSQQFGDALTGFKLKSALWGLSSLKGTMEVKCNEIFASLKIIHIKHHMVLQLRIYASMFQAWVLSNLQITLTHECRTIQHEK